MTEDAAGSCTAVVASRRSSLSAPLALPGILGVVIGGGVGSLARYALSGAVQRAVDPGSATHAFPWGTLVVNVLGCLAIGVLAGADSRLPMSPEARLALAIGFLGGFTTFSGYGLETLRLIQGGHVFRAATYVFAANALGLAAIALGLRMGARG